MLDHLEAQRDLYKHIHDQTLRYMNKGWRPAEIAEVVDLPPGLAERWSVRGYYGTRQPQREGGLSALSQLVRRQSRAISIRCRRRRRRGKFVEYMGGAAAVIARARADFAKGEFRWVAQVMKEVVYAEPDNMRGARALRRRAGADGLPGRVGDLAQRLPLRRAGAAPRRVQDAGARAMLSADTLAGLSTDIFFDMLAIRLDPAKAAGQAMVINWHFTDRDEKLALTLEALHADPSAGRMVGQAPRPRSSPHAPRSTPSCWARRRRRTRSPRARSGSRASLAARRLVRACSISRRP